MLWCGTCTHNTNGKVSKWVDWPEDHNVCSPSIIIGANPLVTTMSFRFGEAQARLLRNINAYFTLERWRDCFLQVND